MRVLWLTLLALVAASVGAGAQERIAERRAIAPDGYIKVYNMAGSIRVVGWDRDTVAVTGSAGERAGRFFMGGVRGAVKLGLERQGEGRAELEIRVPRRSTVWIKTASAEIEVSGVTGALDLYSVNGPIRVNGRLRQLYAESMAGNIDLSAHAPSIRAKAGGGSLVLRGSGDDVSLSTVDGSIRVSGPGIRRGRFESISGSILFEGDVERGGSIAFQSHSGTVELRLPARGSFDFALNTYEGEVRSDFTLPGSSRPRDLRGRELAFSSGSGGADVSVRTYSGPIVLRGFKPSAPGSRPR